MMRQILVAVLFGLLALPLSADAQLDSTAILLKDEGTTQGAVKILDCVGAGITCTRSASIGILTVAGGGGGGGPTTLKTTANQTINGTAFQDITGLTFSVSANTDYAFMFRIVFQSAATTTGFRFGVNGPAGATVEYTLRYQTVANSTTAGVATYLDQHNTAYDSMTVTTSTITAAVDLYATLEGRILVGATGGTFAARVASESANNDLTVRKGSWGLWF